MEEFKAKAETLTKSVGDYFDTYYKLTVVKAADKATGVAASSLAGLATFFLGIFVLFFSLISLLTRMRPSPLNALLSSNHLQMERINGARNLPSRSPRQHLRWLTRSCARVVLEGR